MGGGPIGPCGGFNARANWAHEPLEAPRHSEVLPFSEEGIGAPSALHPSAPTLALPTSLKTEPGRSRFRHRRDEDPGR